MVLWVSVLQTSARCCNPVVRWTPTAQIHSLSQLHQYNLASCVYFSTERILLVIYRYFWDCVSGVRVKLHQQPDYSGEVCWLALVRWLCKSHTRELALHLCYHRVNALWTLGQQWETSATDWKKNYDSWFWLSRREVISFSDTCDSKVVFFCLVFLRKALGGKQ